MNTDPLEALGQSAQTEPEKAPAGSPAALGRRVWFVQDRKRRRGPMSQAELQGLKIRGMCEGVRGGNVRIRECSVIR